MQKATAEWVAIVDSVMRNLKRNKSIINIVIEEIPKVGNLITVMSKPKVKYGGVIKSACNKNSVFCKSGSLRYNKENNQNGGKRYISYAQKEKHENTQINPCVVTKIVKCMKPIKKTLKCISQNSPNNIKLKLIHQRHPCIK